MAETAMQSNDASANAAAGAADGKESKIRRRRTVLPSHPILQKVPRELRHLISGGLAGMLAKTVVAPIDRIKILYQVSPLKFRLRNVPSMAMSIVQHEGLAALWRGNSAMMLRVFPYSGIQFMVFDKCKAHFRSKHEYEKHGITPLESLISGSVAGVVSVVATYPLDLTRAQLAVHYKKKGGERPHFTSVLAANFTRRGFIGLFRGLTPTLLGILPYSGAAFTINEQSKKRIIILTGREPTTIEKMASGGLAGLFAQSFTYPFEVTRRRMQTIGLVKGNFTEQVCTKAVSDTVQPDRGQRASTGKAVPLPMLQTMKVLYLEQGIRGFFKGLSMNWMKGPIAFSISFTAYDIIKGTLEGAGRAY